MANGNGNNWSWSLLHVSLRPTFGVSAEVNCTSVRPKARDARRASTKRTAIYQNRTPKYSRYSVSVRLYAPWRSIAIWTFQRSRDVNNVFDGMWKTSAKLTYHNKLPTKRFGLNVIDTPVYSFPKLNWLTVLLLGNATGFVFVWARTAIVCNNCTYLLPNTWKYGLFDRSLIHTNKLFYSFCLLFLWPRAKNGAPPHRQNVRCKIRFAVYYDIGHAGIGSRRFWEQLDDVHGATVLFGKRPSSCQTSQRWVGRRSSPLWVNFLEKQVVSAHVTSDMACSMLDRT